MLQERLEMQPCPRTANCMWLDGLMGQQKLCWGCTSPLAGLCGMAHLSEHQQLGPLEGLEHKPFGTSSQPESVVQNA